jgi:hypothetical protein
MTDDAIRLAVCTKLDGKAPTGPDGKTLEGTNLALFFAGRIGRGASGPAPSPLEARRRDAIGPTLGPRPTPTPYQGPRLSDKWRQPSRG